MIDLIATQGSLAMTCDTPAAVFSMLQSEYGEIPWKVGTAGPNDVARAVLTLSPDGNWTVVLMLPNGQACGVVSGRALTDAPDDLKTLSDDPA